ncbi:MAG: lysophospholipase [Spirochaetes bacterium]|nr:lysophospholipase [Spirochaetota bacterium]
MLCDESWFEADDGAKLFLRRWRGHADAAGTPEGATPVAALHIVHSAGEHALRYEGLAGKLSPHGIEVWAADMRGHGKTASPEVNDAGRGGLLGHAGDSGGLGRVSADIRALNGEIKKTSPGVPLFLLGHCWGALVVQDCIEAAPSGGEGLAGCILSGVSGPAAGTAALRIKAAFPLLGAISFFKGNRFPCPIARAVVEGSLNKHFRPARTPFDWLSRDETEVDAFISDPACGFTCSVGFYSDLARARLRVHAPEALAKIKRDLPMYIFSGSADPAGDMGAGPTALVAAYKALGMPDLEFVLYPGARHEPLNETNKDEVMENLLSWIMRQVKLGELGEASGQKE